MKAGMVFAAVTIVCWGAYVPMIHHGQLSFGSRNSALRAFLFVGLAYFLLACSVLGYMAVTKAEPLEINSKGATVSTLAGVLGAMGALGVVFAIKAGGKPLLVAPLVFAGAPLVNTLVSMIWDKPEKSPSLFFYFGILLAALGAGLVLRFKPV